MRKFIFILNHTLSRNKVWADNPLLLAKQFMIY